jgi:multidrug efflux pump
MFGMVLAIGLLVDDAIVVVENVERVMAEEGLSPKEATKSMGQIQGALVGIALVLSAVLLPMAFFGGSTGVIYRQFSITIVSAMALSVLVALIFTPALRHHAQADRKASTARPSAASSAGSTATSTAAYAATSAAWATSCATRRRSCWPTADRGRHDLAVHPHSNRVPAGRRPGRTVRPGADPGRLHAERTQVVVDEMRNSCWTKEGERCAVVTVNGFNFAGRGQSSGMAFIMLKPWDERDARTACSPWPSAQQHFFSFRDAMVFAFAPPAVLELGNATGFDVFLQDRAGIGHEKLMEARNQFLGMAAQSKMLAQCVRTA